MDSSCWVRLSTKRQVAQVMREYEQLLIPSCFEVKHVMVVSRGEVAAAIPLTCCDCTAACFPNGFLMRLDE